MLFKQVFSPKNSITVIAEPLPTVKFELVSKPLAAGLEERIGARTVLKCADIGPKVSENVPPMRKNKDVNESILMCAT